ncbi:MAG: hypothetical protein WC716_16660 [Chitinophagaceae bacterium]|jgi:hypothetical protein
MYYQEKRRRLEAALEKFKEEKKSKDENMVTNIPGCYVEDFDESNVVFSMKGKTYRAKYSEDKDNFSVEDKDSWQEVVRSDEYVPVDGNAKEEEMMDKEDKMMDKESEENRKEKVKQMYDE